MLLQKKETHFFFNKIYSCLTYCNISKKWLPLHPQKKVRYIRNNEKNSIILYLTNYIPLL